MRIVHLLKILGLNLLYGMLWNALSTIAKYSHEIRIVGIIIIAIAIALVIPEEVSK